MKNEQTNSSEIREAIIEACRLMNRSGLNQGKSGNISVRDGEGILITPTSLDYEIMQPKDIVGMAFDGSVSGTRTPSTEWRFHLDILKSRPEINVVVHAHPLACTALAIMERGIPPVHYMIAVVGGPSIRCAPYATFGTSQLSENALEALEGRNACLLSHHGMIAIGESLDETMWLANEVETLAKQYLACLPMGEPPVLSDEEIEHVIQQMKRSSYAH